MCFVAEHLGDRPGRNSTLDHRKFKILVLLKDAFCAGRQFRVLTGNQQVPLNRAVCLRYNAGLPH